MNPINHPKKTIAIVLVLLAIAYSYRWTYTPHGRIDYATGLSIHLLTFSIRHKPDPNFDIEFELPVNLAFTTAQIFPTENVARSKDIVIPHDGIDVPARIYWPANIASDKPLPVMVYFHGGGFMLGSVDIFDALTRKIANATKSIVISVDYRLTPAHPYPAAVNDGYAALLWAARNATALGGDPGKLVVGGDSAGANLATVLALKARDMNAPQLRAQILYYPAVDLTAKHYASYDAFGEGYGVTNEMKDVFDKAYVGHVEDKTDPYISPLYADSLAGLPPALIITAGYDLLTEPATHYIDKLKQDKVAVTAINYPGTIHGFMSVPLFRQQAMGLEATAQFMSNTIP